MPTRSRGTREPDCDRLGAELVHRRLDGAYGSGGAPNNALHRGRDRGRDAYLAAITANESGHVLHHDELAIKIDVIPDTLFTPFSNPANLAVHWKIGPYMLTFRVS